MICYAPVGADRLHAAPVEVTTVGGRRKGWIRRAVGGAAALRGAGAAGENTCWASPGAGRCGAGAGRGRQPPKPESAGREMSGFSNSSTLTSLNVITRTFLTNRAGRYMSHTQASCISTSK